MATKKRKKKLVTKKAKSAKRTPTKRSSAARPKKAAPRRPKRAAARKAPARKAAASSAAKRKKARPVAVRAAVAGAARTLRREDRPGHLDPRYAAQLLEQGEPREEEPRAFLDEPRSPNDDLAEDLGEEVVEKATSGEDEGEEVLDQVVPEEQGGPFVETNAAQEFAHGTDPSNPKGAKREPFPRT